MHDYNRDRFLFVSPLENVTLTFTDRFVHSRVALWRSPDPKFMIAYELRGVTQICVIASTLCLNQCRHVNGYN